MANQHGKATWQSIQAKQAQQGGRNTMDLGLTRPPHARFIAKNVWVE